jgi:DNA-binding winged helix-turn-helix (wHTH) protein
MEISSKLVFEFGNCRVEGYKRLLFREGREEKLSANAFDLLLLLLNSRGKVVSQEELRKSVLGDGTGLYHLVSELRLALGDDHRTIIKTVAGQGYQFVAELRETAVEPGGIPASHKSDSIAELQETAVNSRSELRQSPSRRSRSVAFLTVPLLAIALIACFVLVRSLWQKPTGCLQVTIPGGPVIHSDKHLISATGTVPDGGHVWFFIKLEGSRYGWFPQLASRVHNGWEGDAFFGASGEKGKFEVIAVVVDAQTNSEMKKWYAEQHDEGLKDIPATSFGCRSESLVVTKS